MSDLEDDLDEFDAEDELDAEEIGLECHAGHGLNFATAKKIAKIPQIVELNIGHFLIGEAIFNGLDAVIKKMRSSLIR